MKTYTYLIIALTTLVFSECKKKKDEEASFNFSQYPFTYLLSNATIRTGAVLSMPETYDKHNIDSQYEEWVSYSTFSGVSADSGTKVKTFECVDFIPTGRRIAKISGLQPNTTYYAVAFAKYNGEVKVSREVSFTTLNYSLPQFSPAKSTYYMSELVTLTPQTWMPIIMDTDAADMRRQSLKLYINGIEATGGNISTNSINYTTNCSQFTSGNQIFKFSMDGLTSADITVKIINEPLLDMTNAESHREYYSSGDTIIVLNTPNYSFEQIKNATVGLVKITQLIKVPMPYDKLFFIVPSGITAGKYALNLQTGCATYQVDSINVNVAH